MAVLTLSEKRVMTPIDHGWHRLIHEPFAGAWQRNMEVTRHDFTCYPTLYACISRIAEDIAKCPFVLKRKTEDGIWVEVESPAYSPVLRKPNHYQTAQQFRLSWILSKLTQGNAYILKQRDERDVVVKLYVLDPYRVMPLVSSTGDVFYELQTDDLNLLRENGGTNIVVPARDIIHDREVTIHHPLIGVPPLCAAHWPAVKNLKLLRNQAEFFGNGATPGGILSVPGSPDQEIVERLARQWQQNFSGSNAGKVAVIADSMKYDPLKASNADSQLVEQMKYSDEQICQAFGMPPFKIGLGQVPAGWKSDDVNIEYHSSALSSRIEHMENLLDDGLRIQRPFGVELDIYPLWRMDQGKMAEVESTLVSSKIKKPNDGRKVFDLPPADGGDELWGQHQDYPLGVLATRNDLPTISGTPAPDTSEDDETQDDVVRQFLDSLERDYIDSIPEPVLLQKSMDYVRSLAGR
jgi:HK97 family phage portal protein